MAQVYEDPEGARARGAAAAAHIAEHFSTASLARAAQARLDELWGEQDARRAARKAARQAARKAARQTAGPQPAPTAPGRRDRTRLRGLSRRKNAGGL